MKIINHNNVIADLNFQDEIFKIALDIYEDTISYDLIRNQCIFTGWQWDICSSNPSIIACKVTFIDENTGFLESVFLGEEDLEGVSQYSL